jgi:hypothetical protein
VLGILAVERGKFHPTSMHDQEQQQVDRPMADVLELTVLDRVGLRSPGRPPLQDLEVGDLVHRDGLELGRLLGAPAAGHSAGA